MSERNPGLRHRITEVIKRDEAVIVVSGVSAIASAIVGKSAADKGIHSVEDAVVFVGSWGLALGFGFVVGSKLRQIEDRNRK